jgi:hypothetical protein
MLGGLGPAAGLSILPLSPCLGRAPGFPATAALFVVIVTGLLGLVAAATFMMFRGTAGVSFHFGRVHLGAPPSALSSLGFF